MSLVYDLKKYNELNRDDQEYLLDIYRDYYASNFGLDLFDAFLIVSDTKSFQYKDKKNNIKKFSKNYEKAYDSLNGNIELLLIYSEMLNLIGGCRLENRKNNVIRILDIVIDDSNLSVKRDYYEEVLNFLIDYLTYKNIKRIYIDIPFKEGPLLIRANALGFIENPEDIDTNTRETYLLYKDLI